MARWPGTELEGCGLNGRRWAPVGDTCFYPVDLLATGSLELERWTRGGHETRRLDIAEYPYDVQRIELEDDTHVNLSPENAARAGRESQRIGTLWASELDTDLLLPLSPPLAKLPSGGRFGARRIINGEPRNPHTGVDYAADQGTPVLRQLRCPLRQLDRLAFLPHPGIGMCCQNPSNLPEGSRSIWHPP